jgi:hypothetical protein
VRADGLTLVTDPGVGIKAPGWHFVQVGTKTENQPCQPGQVCVLAKGGRGDVIEVNLAGTGGTDFSQVSLPGGQTIYLKPEDVAKGHFYFIPELIVGPSQLAEGTFTGTLTRVNDQGVTETKTETGIVRVNVKDGYSPFTLSGPVGEGIANPDKLDVYRVQQRLGFLDFRGKKTTQAGDSPKVEVTGSDNQVTTWGSTVLDEAIRLFQGAIQPSGLGNPLITGGGVDGRVDAGGFTLSWLNASNAPHWGRVDGALLDARQINYEWWATSWTRDVLLGAINRDADISGRVTSLTEYPDIPWPVGCTDGGCVSFPHARHKAGNDIDIGTADLLPSGTGTQPIDFTMPFNLNQSAITPQEREVVNMILAVVQEAGNNRIADIFIGGTRLSDGTDFPYPRIHAILDALGVPNHSTSPGHDNHIHVTLKPPAIGAAAALSDPDPSFFGTDPRIFYRFHLTNGFEIAGRTDGAGKFSVVLPPNTGYTVAFYQASTNRSTIYAGNTNASGEVTNIGTVILDQFGGVDNTGDGLPDIARYVIGLKVGVRSFAGDGIDDATKIAMGLDPFEGRAFPTGLISSLPLQGNPEKVLPEGNKLYVATGSNGLAIVDGTQFNNPIVLGQLSLGGNATDVGVDANLQIAAVATGSALQLVDVSDPMAPKLSKSVAVSATRVVVANGLAYAVAGSSLDEVDLLTGDVLQTLTLPGFGNVTGLARDGTKLYAYDRGSGTFMDIDISSEAQAAVLGQLSVSIASGDVGVFAANGVAWLAGSGLHTVDVSDPTHPTLIHGADVTFTARRIALNGSGLGVLAPDGNNFVAIYDTSNPNVTANQLLQIPLSGGARNVAISRGIAYVADSAGLEVVNYLPFDNKGVAPQITISTSVPSVDINSLKVLEGTTVPVRADASDDVQVRDVELLVNGQMVRDAVSFPFDFFAIAPTIAQSGSSFTIQAQATDTGGNTMFSNVITIGLVKDTSPPTISSIDPANGASRAEGPQTFRIRFSKSLAAATVTTANFQLTDAKGNTITPARFELRDNDRIVELTYAGLDVGSYQLLINGAGVTDRAGNPLATSAVSNLTITNVAPQFTDIKVTPSVTEGGVATLSGDFADPGSQETYTLLVDWGDGNTQTANLAAGVRSFSVTHQYLDEPPAGTPNSAFPLSVTLSDSNGGSVTVSGHAGASGPIRVAGIGGNYGNQAANQIFASGDLAGSITRVYSTSAFNAMSPADLRASYDVLLITWASDPGLNLDWNTRILPYMALGGDVIYEDPDNIGDLAPAVIGQEYDAGGPFSVAAVQGLTDGIDNSFVNRHTRYTSWDPLLQPFITSGSDTIGLYGAFGSGRIILTGPDQDFHAVRGFGDPYGNQYNLLVNEVRWVSQSSLAVKVTDVAPVVNPIVGPNPSPAVQGQTLSFTGSFSDAGTLDTHQVQWDFGDGTVIPFTPSDAPGALTPTHVYTASGTFTVTLTVQDDDGTTGSANEVVTVASPQFLAGDPRIPTADAPNLTRAQLQPVASRAIDDLAAAGFNVSGLSQADFHVADLPGSLLGLTYQHTIWIDQNAQGYGWYIDVSASSTAAFTQVTGANELQAAPGSPAYGHVDLLTVVTHELGHVLGFASIDPGILGHDWMTATLETGVRRYPDAALGSEPGLPAQLRAEHFPVDMAGPQSASEKQPNSGLAPVASSNPVPMGTVFDNPAPNYVFLDVDSYQSYRLNVMRGMDQALLGTLGQTILSGSAGRGSHIVRLGKRPDLEESIINWIAPDGLATGHANGALSPTIWDDDFGVALLFDHAIDSHDHGLVFMAAR